MKVIRTSAEIGEGWRMCTRQDVEDLPREVRGALKQTIVRSVELEDGQLSVDYEGDFIIHAGEKNYKGWKLMLHTGDDGGSKFRLRWYSNKQWRIATTNDVIMHHRRRSVIVAALLHSTAMSSALKLHTFRLQHGYLRITQVCSLTLCRLGCLRE